MMAKPSIPGAPVEPAPPHQASHGRSARPLTLVQEGSGFVSTVQLSSAQRVLVSASCVWTTVHINTVYAPISDDK